MSPPPRTVARGGSSAPFAPGERFLTVGMVAGYFDVTEVTIKNWVDSGQLLAARTVGGHRRIAASSVVKLLEEQGRPVPAALARRKPLVVVIENAGWSKSMRKTVAPKARVEAESDPWAGLLLVARTKPELVVVDLGIAQGDARRMIAALRSDPNTKIIDVIAVGGAGADARAIAQLVPSAPSRGVGSLTLLRKSEDDAVAEAVLQRIERAPPSPRARRR